MEIAIIADDTKKELITQLCIAYCGILSKHSICATSTTGAYISEATGLKIEKLLSGTHGGEQQIASRIAFDEIDVLFYFRAANPYKERDVSARMDIEQNLLRLFIVFRTFNKLILLLNLLRMLASFLRLVISFFA